MQQIVASGFFMSALEPIGPILSKSYFWLDFSISIYPPGDAYLVEMRGIPIRKRPRS